VLEAATEALARLDSEALGELEERALRVQALLAQGAGFLALPEVMARHRVFAGVVRATGENLRVLERVGMGGTYGDPRALPQRLKPYGGGGGYGATEVAPLQNKDADPFQSKFYQGRGTAWDR